MVLIELQPLKSKNQILAYNIVHIALLQTSLLSSRQNFIKYGIRTSSTNISDIFMATSNKYTSSSNFTNVQKYFFKYARRIELEHRVIGCYAGKAAEILIFIDFVNHL